jgi:hypothetical protein
MKSTIIFRVALCLVLVHAGEAATDAQDRTGHETVWEGVYTDAQARAGRELADTKCVRCHGEALGGGNAQELTGELFVERWREDTLDSIFAVLRTMPPKEPRLADGDYLKILGYILQSNSFPSGSGNLSVRALGTIRMEGQAGPQPLPDRAAVQVVGCMTRSERDQWFLTVASEPVRARNTEPATKLELTLAGDRPLGTGTFELGNFFMLGSFDRAAQEGHKMFAKGALIRGSDGDRISLFSLGSVGRSGCP